MTCPRNRRYHRIAVVGLLCLAALVQFAAIRRAVLPSLDAVRFVRGAQGVERGGGSSVLQTDDRRPLFPIWVAVVHAGLVGLTGQRGSDWATSVQVAAAVPLVLAVVPLYLLLVRLFAWRIALVGGAVFCVLPEVCRLGADGLGDGLNLLLLATAVWAIVEYWAARECDAASDARGERSAVVWLIVAGLATGLAMLARGEAMVLPAALAIALVASVLVGSSTSSARRAAWDAAGYALGLAIVLGPWLLIASASRELAAAEKSSSSGSRAGVVSWQAGDGTPLCFAAKEGSIRRRGLVSAVGQYGEELATLFGYWPGALALWAAWRHRRELARPADRFLQVFFILFSMAVLGFVAREGYASPRHLLPLLVAGIGMVGMGVWEASSVVGRWLAPRVLRFLPGRPEQDARGRRLAWGVVAVVVVVYVALAGRPLRADRVAHRQAGDWLAERAEAWAAVLDTRGWTALGSDHPTYLFNEAKTALADSRLRYVVIEPRELRTGSARAKTLRWLLDTAGERVAEYGGGETSAVAVYRWRGERFRAACKAGALGQRFAVPQPPCAMLQPTLAATGVAPVQSQQTQVRR